jgi:peptide deformylase
MARILTVENRRDARFLKKPTRTLDVKALDRAAIKDLVREMRETMHAAGGVGLSANQIGINLRVFVAEPPPDGQKGRRKFYVVLNPKLVKVSRETEVLEEGCLSIPSRYGSVARPDRIVIEGFDLNGKRIKLKAWGFLARIFQHEIDHLNGKLFTDRAKNVREAAGSK